MSCSAAPRSTRRCTTSPRATSCSTSSPGCNGARYRYARYSPRGLSKPARAVSKPHTEGAPPARVGRLCRLAQPPPPFSRDDEPLAPCRPGELWVTQHMSTCPCRWPALASPCPPLGEPPYGGVSLRVPPS